jgi:hypothetical protein
VASIGRGRRWLDELMADHRKSAAVFGGELHRSPIITFSTARPLSGEKIHLFDMSRNFEFRGSAETTAVPRENDLLCWSGIHS